MAGESDSTKLLKKRIFAVKSAIKTILVWKNYSQNRIVAFGFL